MKPFNLEAAKRGEPLVTRRGVKVTEFHHFESVTLFRTVGTGHASATRLEPGVSVKVRVQA